MARRKDATLAELKRIRQRNSLELWKAEKEGRLLEVLRRREREARKTLANHAGKRRSKGRKAGK